MRKPLQHSNVWKSSGHFSSILFVVKGLFIFGINTEMPHKGTKELHYCKITTGGFPNTENGNAECDCAPITPPVFSVCFLSAVQISPCKGRTGPSCFCCSASVPEQNTSWPARGFPALLGCTLPARDRKRYTTVMFCYRSSDLVESSWRTLEGRVIDSEAWKKTFTVPQRTVRNTGDCAGLSSSALRDKTPLSHNCGNTNEGHTYSKTFPSSFVADYAKQSSVSLTVIDGTVWGFPLISF